MEYLFGKISQETRQNTSNFKTHYLNVTIQLFDKSPLIITHFNMGQILAHLHYIH